MSEKAELPILKIQKNPKEIKESQKLCMKSNHTQEIQHTQEENSVQKHKRKRKYEPKTSRKWGKKLEIPHDPRKQNKYMYIYNN